MLSQIPTLMCDTQLSGVPILHEGNRLSYLTGCTANVGKVKRLGGKSLGAEPAVHTMLNKGQLWNQTADWSLEPSNILLCYLGQVKQSFCAS